MYVKFDNIHFLVDLSKYPNRNPNPRHSFYIRIRQDPYPYSNPRNLAMNASMEIEVWVRHVSVLLTYMYMQARFFYRPKFTEISKISVLSTGSDKIWYRPNFFLLSCSHTDNSNSVMRRSHTYNVLFLFLSVNQWCLIA